MFSIFIHPVGNKIPPEIKSPTENNVKNDISMTSPPYTKRAAIPLTLKRYKNKKDTGEGVLISGVNHTAIILKALLLFQK